VAAIAIFVLAERLLPGGRTLGRVTGIFMLVWGIWLITSRH
jgi:predicted metal-binding membrane protein